VIGGGQEVGEEINFGVLFGEEVGDIPQETNGSDVNVNVGNGLAAKATNGGNADTETVDGEGREIVRHYQLEGFEGEGNEVRVCRVEADGHEDGEENDPGSGDVLAGVLEDSIDRLQRLRSHLRSD